MKQVLQVEKDDAEPKSETVDTRNQYVDWIDYFLEQDAARSAAAAIVAEQRAKT